MEEYKEPCTNHSNFIETCEWCKMNAKLEKLLDETGMERSEEVRKSAERMAMLRD